MPAESADAGATVVVVVTGVVVMLVAALVAAYSGQLTVLLQ